MYKPGDFVKTTRGLYYIVNVHGDQYDIVIADKYIPVELLGVVGKVPVGYKPKFKVLEIEPNMYYNTIKEIFYSDAQELKKVTSGQ